MLTRGLSNHFQISHTINMSSVTPSGYRFGATYVGTKQLSPTEAYPILLGDIDPSGNLNATIIHQLHPSLQTKFGAQVSVNETNFIRHFADSHRIFLVAFGPQLNEGLFACFSFRFSLNVFYLRQFRYFLNVVRPHIWGRILFLMLVSTSTRKGAWVRYGYRHNL